MNMLEFRVYSMNMSGLRATNRKNDRPDLAK